MKQDLAPISLDAPGIKQTIYFHTGFELPRVEDTDRVLYVFDANTHRLFGETAADTVVIPDGEEFKRWESVDTILTRAVEVGLTRRSVFVGVGGGVVGDVAAFAASIYMRGCRVLLVPTTLLAMVDAAIGGKTGINFQGFKNMVGTFSPAAEVHVSIAALSSLPEREYHSGMAEVIKTAALGDPELFRVLEKDRSKILARDPGIMADAVRRCAAVKVRVVEVDPTEQGQRAWLNLGHTFAHALESVAGFGRYTHGEAVAWGMARAMALGVQLGLTDSVYAARLVDMLRAYGFDVELEGIDASALIEAMGRDKKRQSSRLRFVLQEDLCRTVVQEVDPSDLRKVIA